MNLRIPAKTPGLCHGLLQTAKSCRSGAKLFRMTKLVIILIAVFVLEVNAEAKAQKITLSEKDAPLEKIMNAIKAQTGYYFLYNSEFCLNLHLFQTVLEHNFQVL